MANRITGMYSGLDTESLIQELVKAKSTKVTKYNSSKTKLEWKQDKWKDLNTQIKSLYSSMVSKMQYASSYSKKTTSVSNSSAVSVITGEDAMNSVQTLSVKELAATGYLTGATITSASDEKVSKTTTLGNLKHGDISLSDGGSFSISVNGKTVNIDVNADTTISEVVKKLNSAGVNASFDENYGRIFLGAKESGKNNDFILTANDDGGLKALSVLGINASLSENTTKEYEKLAGMSSYLVYNGSDFDAENTVTNIQSDTSSEAYSMLMDLAKSEYQNKISAKSSEVTNLKNAVTELEKKDTSEMSSDELATHNASLEQAKADYESAKSELDEMNVNLKAETYDSDSMEKAAVTLKNKIEFAQNSSSIDSDFFNTGAVRLSGKDSEIILNGASFTSSTNNIKVNGLTFTCLAKADNITVTTQDDTDGIYDMIKDFFKEYNKVIIAMDKAYNAESASNYDVLTDEEKEAMSEKEIETWESKIKDSILRKDSTLGTLFNSMKDIMASGYEVNGKTLHLSDFGINTLSYFNAADNEKAAYHIDGDSDDSDTMGNADVLKGMIATDSSSVITFFTSLSNALYKKMGDLSASSDYSSFGSFYDDKKLKTELSDWESKIADAQEKLDAYEDKWYSKFSSMETALSKLDSKNSYLSNLFS